MSTEHEYHIMRLSDSFFPSGMFSMSAGLESLVNHGKIKNWQEILKFITEQIEFQLLPCDCAVVSITIGAVQKDDLALVIETDNRYHSMKLAKEIRNSSVRSGRQIFNCLRHVITKDNEKNRFISEFNDKIESKQTPCTYPVVLGITAACLKIPKDSMTRMLLYSFSSSVASAAIRLGVASHLDAQKILMLLAEPINKYVSANKQGTIDDIWQLTPKTEIYQMDHEHNESKMFIT